ncbi:histone acetyltransferase 1 [Collariella sp. IMI 366227]|nr:histone acetyltransferase 1 [Collariella sp. IMI 366227]
MSSDDDWSTSANDAIFVSLVSPSSSGLKTVGHSFNPAFTYSLFGENQEIFGYRDLEINLRYNANDMRPNLAITYKKKFPAVGENEATDVNEVLGEFLPEVAFQKKSDFEKAIKKIGEDWTPPGKLATTFHTKDKTFEVWEGKLTDPAVKQLIRRIQILVPLFIEGGTEIDLEDPDADRWAIFFLYQKKATTAGQCPYIFAGYSTVYRFIHFHLPPPPLPTSIDETQTLAQSFDLSNLPCRHRISQFLIIPLFQQQGLGPRLYSHLFTKYIAHPQTVEITVEDPNEAFDDLRDVADLHYLRTLPEFLALHIDTSLTLPKTGNAPANIVDRAAADAVRAKAKMAPRQFARMLEMHLMSQLPAPVRRAFAPGEDDDHTSAGTGAKPTKEQAHEYRLWRLMLKKRIYKHNKDALGELEVPERIAKLDETVSSVEFDYARLLLKAEEQREKREEEDRVVAKRIAKKAENGSGMPAAANGKRKAVGEEEGEPSASKKARVEGA